MKDDEAFAHDRDEFEKVLNEEPRRGSRRGVIALVAGVAVVAAIGIALAVGAGGLGTSAAPGGAPGTGASSSPSAPAAAPGPSDSPEPDPSTASPTPEPDGPDGGQEADPGDRETLPPADLDEPVAVEGGPRVSVSSIEEVDGEAVLPGEVSGPAVRITVRVENDSDAAIDLTTAVVTLYGGESGLQASPVSKPAGKAFPAEVAAGETAGGSFVFELPEDQRSGVRVEVDLSVSDPLIAFEGDIG